MDGVRRSAAVVVAVTLQRLVDDASRSWSLEEQLVLDALRRSSTALKDASDGELADYVGSLNSSQLRGVLSNVKGIYHELLFAHAENHDGDEISARLFEQTNHPGADVEFIVDGDVVRSVQLKAVVSPDAIFEHLAKYPDIEVVSTEEVAAGLKDVQSSGFSNEAIGRDVLDVFGELPGDGLVEEVADGAVTSALVAGAIAAGHVLKSGRVSRLQLRTALGDLSVGVVTATILDHLLDGITS